MIRRKTQYIVDINVPGTSIVIRHIEADIGTGKDESSRTCIESTFREDLYIEHRELVRKETDEFYAAVRAEEDRLYALIPGE